MLGLGNPRGGLVRDTIVQEGRSRGRQVTLNEREGVNFTITPRNSRNLLHSVAFCCIFLVIVKFRAGRMGWSGEEPFDVNVPKNDGHPRTSGDFSLIGLVGLLSRVLCRRYVGCYQCSTGVRLRQIRVWRLGLPYPSPDLLRLHGRRSRVIAGFYFQTRQVAVLDSSQSCRNTAGELLVVTSEPPLDKTVTAQPAQFRGNRS